MEDIDGSRELVDVAQVRPSDAYMYARVEMSLVKTQRGVEKNTSGREMFKGANIAPGERKNRLTKQSVDKQK